MNDDQRTVSRSNSAAKVVRKTSGVARFAERDVHALYERHLALAQDHFLKRAFTTAAGHAARAARVHPTAHIFALMAAIQEGLGHFDRASDFRLLQSFLANDVALWEELLGEFLEQQRFFKATVCIQRLSALEHKDAHRYRSLQIQLADLYVGLGEVRRATTILVNLWQGSRYRDFEVFASLSSMFFQLGRWSAMNQLIKESLEHGFRRKRSATSSTTRTRAGDTVEAEAVFPSQTQREDGPAVGVPSGASTTTKSRGSKRVVFMDEIMTQNEEDFTQQHSSQLQLQEEKTSSQLAEGGDTHDHTAASKNHTNNNDKDDDFQFDNLNDVKSTSAMGGGTTSSDPSAVPRGSSSSSDDSLDNLDLSTPLAIKNLLTLVNVHAELLNEQGKFDRTTQLIIRCAALLQCPTVLDLPPDVLLRYGVALAYQGDVGRCDEVFEHLLMSSSLETYGDALYDAAVSLLATGRYERAAKIFEALRRFQRLTYHEEEDLDEGENDDMNDGDADDATNFYNVSSSMSLEQLERRTQKRQARAKRNEARQTAKTSEAALTFHIGKCLLSLGRESDAFVEFQKVIELDPRHVGTRVELSKLYLSLGDSERAESIVSPHDDDDPFQVTVLSAQLLPVLRARGKYLDGVGVGVALFQLFLVDSDNVGDRMSTASGASGASTRRRSNSVFAMPTLTRASSSIVPASQLSHAIQAASGGGSILQGNRTQSLASATFGSVGAKEAIAASFRSIASPSSAVSIVKRGSMTSTYAGTAAATSIAGGMDGGAFVVKDTSALFAFNWKRRRDGATAATTKQLTARQRSARDRKALAQQRVFEYEATYMKAKKQSGADGDEENVMPPRPDDNVGNDNGSVGNLAELEEMERMLADEEELLLQEQQQGEEVHRKRRREEAVASNDDEDEDGTDSSRAPRDIHAVARATFEDPDMAALFIACTSGGAATQTTQTPNNNTQQTPSTIGGGGGGDGMPTPLTQLSASASLPTAAAAIQPPTSQDIIRLLGRSTMIHLATIVVDCYMKIDRYVEAKEFATIVLVRWTHIHKQFRSTANSLANPLRLAMIRCAIAIGNTQDVTTIGMQLIANETSSFALDRTGTNEMWSIFNKVIVSHSKSLTPLLQRLIRVTCNVRNSNDEDHADNNDVTTGTTHSTSSGELSMAALHEHRHMSVPALCALGNSFIKGGSSRTALNMFLLALSLRPDCPFLNFMAGLTYCLTSSNRVTVRRDDAISSGLHYLQEYRRLMLSEIDLAVQHDWQAMMSLRTTTHDERVGEGGNSNSEATSAFWNSRLIAEVTIGAQFRLASVAAASSAYPASIVRDSKRFEVDYNTARILHFLGLHYLAVPMYHRVVEGCKKWLEAHDDVVAAGHVVSRAADVDGGGEPSQRSSAAVDSVVGRPPAAAAALVHDAITYEVTMLLHVASLNLYYLYTHESNNPTMALSVLPKYVPPPTPQSA